jgi:D-alanine-D-alanine ligase
MTKKLRVAVIYGGRSGEHEISLRSAASVVNNLDRSRYEVVPIAIDKQGRWLLGDVSLIEQTTTVLPVYDKGPKVVLPPNPSPNEANLVPLQSSNNSPQALGSHIDVVFPVMHGPLCEDGSIQGLLQLADLPFVGSGVLGSAIGMDKDVAKRLAREAGIPIVPWVTAKKEKWLGNPAVYDSEVEKNLGYPCFVKPANLGSSVGVHKVKEKSGLQAALKDSFQYDTKVLIEKAINAREIEVAILGNPDPSQPPLASIAGEIVPTHEFYSYESKYLDENGAVLKIPAEITPAQMKEVQALAQKTFAVLEGEGLARVDFFLDKDTGKFYLNEVNTLPGFTSISMYPKLWEASGIGYQALLTRLIELAVSKHQRNSALVRDFHAK